MSQMDDLIKKLLEEKTASANSHMSQFGDKIGINKLLTNPLFQKLRLAAVAGKGGLHTLGAEKIDSMFGAGSYGNALVDTSGAALGLSTPFKGREIAKQIEMANVRKRLQSQAGYNNTGRDAIASTAASMANMKSMLNSSAMLAMVSGVGSGGMITPGIMASKMFGGIDALGSATTHGLAGTAGALGAGQGVTSAIGGMNPMMMGMMAAMAATKMSSSLYKMAIEGGSSLKLGKKELITTGTSPHQLEQDYGNTSALRMQISRMQNSGMLKPSEALIANILAMIEGHTSVLPYIAANAIDSESRRNKEGAGNAQNNLEDLFGNTGAIGSNDQLRKGKMGIVSKLFTGMEKTTANLSATFDIMGQLSNTLAGNSSTKLYNEANTKDKTPEMLKAEKKFGETFGIPTGMVQAIHTTPAQIMNSSDTYEGKVLSILGLNSEINRFSAHELLKIRTTGFGIKNETTNGFLAKLNEQYEEERLHKDNDGVGRRMLKGVDELLGYIPGFNVLSGSVKMINGAMDTLNQFEDDLAKGKVRSVGKVFTDWMEEGITNDILNSETALRNAVGATELGAQDQMANYLGLAYPDRFELLLSYNLSQMESLKAMAGNVDYSKNEKLSMNKYTGVHGNKDYHDSVDSDIKSKMEEQIDLLNDPTSWMENMFFNEENLKKAKQNQVKKGMETNDFLKSFIAQNPDSELKDEPQRDPQDREMSFADFIRHEQEKDAEAARNSGSDTAGVSSADDLTDRQRTEEVEERKMSFAEQQVALLQEIRDCCTGQEGRDYDMENARAAREKKKDDEGAGGAASLLSGMTGGAMGSFIGRTVPLLPRFGVYGIAIAGALAAAYIATDWFSSDEPKNSAEKSLEQGSLEFQNKVHTKIDNVGEASSSEERATRASHLTNEEIEIGLNNNWGLSAGVNSVLKAEQLKRGYFFPVSSDSVLHRPSDWFSKKKKYYYVLMQNGEGPSIDRLFKADAPSISQMISVLDDGPEGLSPLFKKLLSIQQQLEGNTTSDSWKKLQKEKIAMCNEIVTKSNSLRKVNDPKDDSTDKSISSKATSPYTSISGRLNINQSGDQRVRVGSGGEALTFQQQFAQQSGTILTGDLHNQSMQLVRGQEGGYTTLQKSDSHKNDYAFGAYQLNEGAGKLKEFIGKMGGNNEIGGKFYYGVDKKYHFRSNDGGNDRTKLDKFLEKLDPAKSKSVQDQMFIEGYETPVAKLAKSLNITDPAIILQMIDHANNRGAGTGNINDGSGVSEMMKIAQGLPGGFTPENIKKARDINYNSLNDKVHLPGWLRRSNEVYATAKKSNSSPSVNSSSVSNNTQFLNSSPKSEKDLRKLKEREFNGYAGSDKFLSNEEIVKAISEQTAANAAHSTAVGQATLEMLQRIHKALMKPDSKPIDILAANKLLNLSSINQL